MQAILLISHGSRSPKTKQEVKALVRKLKPKAHVPIFKYAFLEIESPDISTGIEQCVKEGATDILVLLNFLNSGRHVDQDIPAIIEQARKVFPQIKIRISSAVGQHARIVDLFLDIIRK